MREASAQLIERLGGKDETLLCSGRRLLLLVCASLCACIGCDPVRTTVQPVVLRVTASGSSEIVRDADVSLKYDYDRNVPAAEQRPEAQRPTSPWFSGTTGDDGKAEVSVRWTMLDRTLGSSPPDWRDQVTGKHYLIRVGRNQVQETASLAMHAGALVRGDVFTVQVVEIQEPRYVQTE